MTTYHIHHIIPKHMGGTDDPSNLIKLTIEEHAEAHKELYEKHGNHYDLIAFKCISGLVGMDEIMSETIRESNRRRTGWRHIEEARKKMSDKLRENWHNRPPVTEEARLSMSAAQLASGHRRQKVRCIQTGIVYDSVNECANALGITRRTICTKVKPDARPTFKCPFTFEYL